MIVRHSFLAATTALLCLQCGAAPADDRASATDRELENGEELVNVPVRRSATAAAASPYQIRAFVAAGTGCPVGSIEAVDGQDNGLPAITLQFGQFSAEGQSAVSGRARGDLKTCQVAFNLQPLQGYQIGLTSIETRGDIDVLGAQDTARGINNAAKLSREFFFNDANSGLRFPILDSYLVNTFAGYVIEEGTNGIQYYGACNATVTARARLGLNVTGANNFASIGALDGTGGVKFKLLTRACTTEGPSFPGFEDILGGDDRAVIKNACALRSAGTNAQRMVCYGPSGEILP